MAGDVTGTICLWCRDTENDNGLITLPVQKCFPLKLVKRQILIVDKKIVVGFFKLYLSTFHANWNDSMN